MIRQQSQPEAAAIATSKAQRWRVAGICLVLIAITFAVFGQTAGFRFVNFDDDGYVYENAQVAGGLSMKGLAWVFTHADCDFYHPLTMLSLMADDQLHGLQPGGYHVTNVLLHAASVILLFLVLRQMTGALWRSAFVAAVFAIHPLRAESVAWVAERKDVLGAFFFMLTLGAYVRFVRKPNSLARYLMVAAAFVLALLSKPTVVTLPFVLLLLDYWPLQRMEPGKLAGLVREKIPLLALAIAAGVATVLAEGESIAANTNVSMPARLGNAVVSYAIYLRQMIWPEGLAAFYPQPEKGHPVWTIVLCFLLLALITGGVLVFQRKRPWLLTGWLWYVGMLMPMIGIVQVGPSAHADRMTYLPQIGLYVLLTWAAAGVSAGWRHQREALGGLAAIILVALIICARTQTGYWRDSETLWSHALACTTDNSAAQLNLGAALMGSGKEDEAIAQYQKALQIKPDLGACINLGAALLHQGRVDEAIAQYEMALQIEPNSAEAHYNLGAVLVQKGRIDEAITHFQKVSQIRPDYAEPHSSLGNIYLQKGNFDAAIAQFQIALHTKPNDADVHNHLGVALFKKGKTDEAIAHFQSATQLKPDDAQTHYNFGLAFRQMGKMGQAATELQKALQLEPNNPQIQNALAWLLATCADASLRNGEKAVQLARQANALAGGKNPMFLDTLAAAYAEAGRFSEAVESAQEALRLAEAQSNAKLIGVLQSELKLYQADRPFHSPEQTH